MAEATIRQARQDSLQDVIDRYPEVPRLIIIKTDVQRRGVFYTEKALGVLNEAAHQVTGTHIFGARDGQLEARPESLLLRDGTSIITTPTPLEDNPYTVDLIDGKLWLLDAGEPVEEVDYWPAPDFYALTSSSGIDIGISLLRRSQEDPRSVRQMLDVFHPVEK